MLTSVAVATSAGGFLADFNRTHLFNPAWPAQARFHDATTTLGSLLGVTSRYFLHRQYRDPQQRPALGALLPSLFWTAQGVAFAFPGTDGCRLSSPSWSREFAKPGSMNGSSADRSSHSRQLDMPLRVVSRDRCSRGRMQVDRHATNRIP
jgi:hypothetical protein